VQLPQDHSSAPPMSLTEITAESHDVLLDIAYATARNITGAPIYRQPLCFLHPDALARLEQAIALAGALGLRFKIFDAFRPTEAQWVLWNARPDPEFLADPRRGSPHSRGAAIDLTLVDSAGSELDMGTGFDAFTPLSHHAATAISVAAQRNRLLLLGLMTAAGWDFYRNEWWHYQLFDAKRYPLFANAEGPRPML
jgi:zinc D-Ala-D-Ala dipeptidase